MSSYTQELQWLLRGFSDFNEKPQLYASPQSIIENSRKNFFKAVGNYPFKIWGDERDIAFKEEFERSFLEYFFMKEYGYQTPDAFILQLGSFLRRKMPIYCQHWRMILDEMYITQTGNTKGNVTGNTVNNDSRVTGSKSRSLNHSDSSGTTDAKSVNRSGVSNTPQNELDIDLDNISYASQVQKADNASNTNTTGKSRSESHSGDYTASLGDAKTDSITDSITNTQGRSKDVFDIYDEWVKSGYDLFTPLFKEMMKEEIFVIFN